jgi:hypothetical protein
VVGRLTNQKQRHFFFYILKTMPTVGYHGRRKVNYDNREKKIQIAQELGHFFRKIVANKA